MRLFLLFLFAISLTAAAEDAPSPRFVRNNGQWETAIIYRAAIPGGFVFVKRNSLQYVFYHTGDVARQHPKPVDATVPVARQAFKPGIGKNIIRAHGFEVVFAGSSPGVRLQANGERIEQRNFFLDNDPAHWAAAVPAFSEIVYQDIYPGINVRLFAQNGSLKYEFVVAPQADPNQIRLHYRGMDRVSLDNGFLTTETSVNKTTETPPYCYQLDKNGIRREVPSGFALQKDTISFAFPKGYNAKQPLVIDPVLVFSTYSGSYSDNWGFTATYDKEGNLYSGGIEFGNRFPATNGAFQVTFNGQVDVAILKYSPQGNRLIHATYIGGAEADVPHSLIVNDRNELVIMGTTSSRDFPVTANAYDRSYNGGQPTDMLGIPHENGSDLFVTKLNAAASGLAGSTYIGGSRNDGLNEAENLSIRNYGDEFRGEVNLDKEGNIYFAATTVSNDFPTVGASQTQLRGAQDGIVCRFSTDLSVLAWSTYVGGTGFDAAYGIRIAPSGGVYVVGGTTSRDLPSSVGAIKTAMTDDEDGFVVRFDNQRLDRLSYLGTNAADQAYLIDLDADENVYVLGLTFGVYPITRGAYSNANSGQFIHAFNSTFSRTVFSTVIGTGRRQPDFSPTAFMRSDCGFIYLSGWGGNINDARGIKGSSTSGLPTTPDAFRAATNGDDFYLAILNQNATQLLYGTFFGSPQRENHVDGGTSRFSPGGTIYHAACCCADNSTFPTSPGVWSNRNNGTRVGSTKTGDGCNNAAFKFDLEGLEAEFDLSADSCGAPAQVRVTNKSLGGKTFQWVVNGQVQSAVRSPAAFTLSQPGEYTITLRAFDPVTCKKVDSVSRKVTLKNLAFAVSKDTTICSGQSVQLKAAGGVKYAWTPNADMKNPQSATPTVTPKQTTTYTAQVTNDKGCVQNVRVTVVVNPEIQPEFEVQIRSECGAPTRLRLVNNGTNRIEWERMDEKGNIRKITGDTLTLDTNQYEIVARVFRGACEKTFRQRVKGADPRPPVNVLTPNEPNTHFETFRSGWKLEIVDQWGRAVYADDSYQNDWKAANRANGVYYYKLTSPEGTSCKGWVQVLR